MRSAKIVGHVFGFPAVPGVHALHTAVSRFARRLDRRLTLLRQLEVEPVEGSYAERRFESALKGPR